MKQNIISAYSKNCYLKDITKKAKIRSLQKLPDVQYNAKYKQS